MSSIHIIKGNFKEKMELPIAEGLKAGFPSPAEDYNHETLDFDRSIEAQDGDIVVGYINDEFTIKYLDLRHRKDGYIELRPANKNFKPIRIDADDDFEVWGVVIWTIKRWK